MTRTTFQAICFCYWLVVITIIYLLALWLAAPLWAAGLVILAASAALLRFRPAPVEEDAPAASSQLWPALILLAGLSCIAYTAFSVAEKSGHWDAWWFWNPRAAFLASPQYWKLAFSGDQYGTMFTLPVAHSDYPPFLPLLNGLCWRLLQMQPSVVPYAWSICSLLLIPAVLFLELYPRNKAVAIAALFFLTTQDRMVLIGTGQVADGWIALFLLLSFMSCHVYMRNRDKASAFWTGAMMGALLWTKNEGMILAGGLLLLMLRQLIRHKGFGPLLAGIALPLTAFICFKMAIAPANDIIAAQSHWPWEKLTDLSRYREIGRLTWDIMKLYFPAIPFLLAGYFILCIIERKRPDPEVPALVICFAAYLGVYLITPHSIGWHINTSADRLIFQLMPALLWVVSRRLSVTALRLPRPSS